MILRILLSVMLFLTTLPATPRAQAVGGVGPYPAISITQGAWQVLAPLGMTVNSRQIASEILFLSITDPKDLWVNLGVVNSLAELGGRAMLVSSVGRRLFEADLQLKRDAKQVLARLLVGEGIDEVDLEEEQFRFWIEPKDLEVIRDGDRYAVDTLRLRVRYETESEWLRPVLEKAGRILEKKVNTAREYEPVRQVAGEVALAQVLGKRIEKEELERLFFNTGAFYEVAGYWDKADVLAGYVRTFFGEDSDVVAGGVDFRGIGDYLKILPGDLSKYAVVKTIDVERDLPEIAKGLMERWQEDDPARGYEEEDIRGLIEAYFLRLWIPVALRVDRKRWKDVAKRLIGITGEVLGRRLIEAGEEASVVLKFRNQFDSFAKEYVNQAEADVLADGSAIVNINIPERGRKYWIPGEGKKIKIWVSEGRMKEVKIWGERVVKIKPEERRDGDKILAFLNKDGDLVIKDGELLDPKSEDAKLLSAHYLFGHVATLYMKKYQPERWKRVEDAFRKAGERDSGLLLDFYRLRYGRSSERGIWESRKNRFERWVDDEGKIIWYRVADEMIAMWAEIGALPEKRRTQLERRFYDRITQIFEEVKEYYWEGLRSQDTATWDVSCMGEYACISDKLYRKLKDARMQNERMMRQVELLIERFNLKVSRVELEQITSSISEELRNRLLEVLDGFKKDKIAYVEIKRAYFELRGVKIHSWMREEDAEDLLKNLKETLGHWAALKLSMLAKLRLLEEILKEVEKQKQSEESDIKEKQDTWKEAYEELSKAETGEQIGAIETKLNMDWHPLMIFVKGALSKVIEDFLDGKIKSKKEFFSALKEELTNSQLITDELKLSQEQIERIIGNIKDDDSFRMLYEMLDKGTARELGVSQRETVRQVSTKVEKRNNNLSDQLKKVLKSNAKSLVLFIFVLGALLIDVHFGFGYVHAGMLPAVGALLSSSPGKQKKEEKKAPSWLQEIRLDELFAWWDEKKSVVYERRFFQDALKQVNSVIGRKNGRSGVIFLGRASAGKSLLLSWLSYRLLSGETLHDNVRVFRINTSMLTQFEPAAVADEIKKFVSDVRKDGDIPVIIADEIHRLARMSPSVLELLKEVMESSDERHRVILIGATTNEEWDAFVRSKDKALASRFTEMQVPQVSQLELKQLLLKTKRDLEDTYKVEIDLSAIEYISRKMLQLFPNAPQPREALDLLHTAIMEKIQKIPRYQLKDAIVKLYDAVLSYRHASGRQERIIAKKELKKAIQDVEKLYRSILESGEARLTKEDIDRIFEERGIPRIAFTEDKDEINEWVDGLKRYLKQEIIGQEDVIETVAEKIRTALLNPDRKGAIGVFLLAGPTGTGKTELAEAVARYISGDEDRPALVKESGEQIRHIKKLTGAEPSYVGYGEDTFISRANEKMQQSPMVVLLIDEVEKSPVERDLIQTLVMQAEKPGGIKDNKGRELNTRNAIIFFTTNKAPEGYWPYDKPREEVKEVYLQAVHEMFKEISGDVGNADTKSPELARFSAVEVMPPLGGEDVRKAIEEKYLPKIGEIFKEDNIVIHVEKKEKLMRYLERVYEEMPNKGFRRVLDVVNEIKAALVQAIDRKKGDREVWVKIRPQGKGWEVKIIKEEPIQEDVSLDLEGKFGDLIRDVLKNAQGLDEFEFAKRLQSINLPRKNMPKASTVSLKALINDAKGSAKELLLLLHRFLKVLSYDGVSAVERLPLLINLLRKKKQSDSKDVLDVLMENADAYNPPVSCSLVNGELYLKVNAVLSGEWIDVLDRLRNKEPVEIQSGYLTTPPAQAIEAIKAYTRGKAFDWGVDGEGNLILQFDVANLLQDAKAKGDEETRADSFKATPVRSEKTTDRKVESKKSRREVSQKESALGLMDVLKGLVRVATEIVNDSATSRRVYAEFRSVIERNIDKLGDEDKNRVFALLSFTPRMHRDREWKSLVRLLVAKGAIPTLEAPVPYDEQVKVYWETLYDMARERAVGDLDWEVFSERTKQDHLVYEGVVHAPREVMFFLRKLHKLGLGPVVSQYLEDVKKDIKDFLNSAEMESLGELLIRQALLDAIKNYSPGLWSDDEIKAFDGVLAHLINLIATQIVAPELGFGKAILRRAKAEMEKVGPPPFPSKDKYEFAVALYELAFYAKDNTWARNYTGEVLANEVLRPCAEAGRYIGSDPTLLLPAFLEAHEELSNEELVAVTRILMKMSTYSEEKESDPGQLYRISRALMKARLDGNRHPAMDFNARNSLVAIKDRLAKISADSEEYRFISYLLEVLDNPKELGVPSNDEMYRLWLRDFLETLRPRSNIGDLDLDGSEVRALKENTVDVSVISDALSRLGDKYSEALGGLLDYAQEKLSSMNLKIYTFRDPRYRDNRILLARSDEGEILITEPLLQDPIAVFHEVMEWLAREGLISSGIDGNKVFVKDKDGNVLVEVRIDESAIDDDWVEKAKMGNVHYALRVLQRQVFGEEDVQLSGLVRLWKIVMRLKSEGIGDGVILRAFEAMGLRGSLLEEMLGMDDEALDTKESQAVKETYKEIVAAVREDEEIKALLQYIAGGQLYLGEEVFPEEEGPGLKELLEAGIAEGGVEQKDLSRVLVRSTGYGDNISQPKKIGGVLLTYTL